MPVRPEVRDTQRVLAALDAAHGRAAAALERARARRAQITAAADAKVAAAQATLDRAVADMAAQFTPELAAQVLGLPTGRVRRIAQTHSGADR